MHGPCRHTLVFALASLPLLAACPSRDVAAIDPETSKEGTKSIPVEINRDLDILFIIDDSGSMRDNQARLVENLPRFMEVLRGIDGGLPNVHIGVTSTDVGAAPHSIPGCQGTGDSGRLLTRPTMTADGTPCRHPHYTECTAFDTRPPCPTAPGQLCTPPDGNWIVDVARDDGSREVNYAGSLEETFACIATLGVCGCGLEQPLEAMRRALDGSNPENADFLRDDAFLAIIILTDEDDCSMLPGNMLADTTDRTVDSPLGPLDSFRCTEFGVECEPDFLGYPDRTSYGPRQDCRPRDDSPYMPHPREYIDFLDSLKSDRNLIFTAAIKGPPEPLAIVEASGRPTLAAACKDPPDCNASTGPDNDCDASADPGVRLAHFFDGFPGRNTQTSICNADLSGALTQIAEELARFISSPCLEGDLKLDADGWPNCVVEHVLHKHTDDEERRLVSRCPDPTNPAPDAPCWYVEPDLDQCAATPTQLAITIEPGPTSLPAGTYADIRCELE